MTHRPLRIIQIASFMAPEHGGAEIWLMNVLRRIDRKRFQMDFLVHTDQPRSFHDEIRALGSKIIPCVRPINLWRYAFQFRRILREHGPYDIVHTHILYGAFVLRLARWCGVPIRIFHAHADRGSLQGNGFLIDTFFRITDPWIFKDATCGLAVSQSVADSRFGPNWRNDPRWKVLYCGIDLAPFEVPVDRAQVRTELGIPPDAFVIGHVGRFAREKNHTFLLKVAKGVINREPRARLLLVGDGELRPVIEKEIQELGIRDKVILAGMRNDVPRLLRGAMDVFVFPSLTEGLGLSLVEAQAAGLRSVVSEAVPKEVEIVKDSIIRIPFSDYQDWENSVLQFSNLPKIPDGLSIIQDSKMALEKCVSELEILYLKSTEKV